MRSSVLGACQLAKPYWNLNEVLMIYSWVEIWLKQIWKQGDQTKNGLLDGDGEDALGEVHSERVHMERAVTRCSEPEANLTL